MIEHYSLLFFNREDAPILPTASSGGTGAHKLQASNDIKVYRDLELDPSSLVIEYVPTGLKHKSAWLKVKAARPMGAPEFERLYGKAEAAAPTKKGKG